MKRSKIIAFQREERKAGKTQPKVSKYAIKQRKLYGKADDDA